MFQKQREENKGEWFKHGCSEDGVIKKKYQTKKGRDKRTSEIPKEKRLAPALRYCCLV